MHDFATSCIRYLDNCDIIHDKVSKELYKTIISVENLEYWKNTMVDTHVAKFSFSLESSMFTTGSKSCQLFPLK